MNGKNELVIIKKRHYGEGGFRFHLCSLHPVTKTPKTEYVFKTIKEARNKLKELSL
jgi:hypothetical protein